jgi:hypothetical protein
MLYYKLTNAAFVIAVSLSITGCGLKTPDMQLTGEPITSDLVNDILSHVEDELGCAINGLIEDDMLRVHSLHTSRAYAWLDKATAKISLKLTVDEKSTINAGLSYSDFYTNAISTIGKTIISTPRSFVLGASAGGSSDATRIDNSDYTLSVGNVFVRDSAYYPGGQVCKTLHDGFGMDSDLHIKDWLRSRLEQYALHPEIKQNEPDTLTTDITFIFAYNGNVTPTWHLVPTSYNTGGSSFFNAARTRTNDLIITIGATKDLAATAQNIQKQNSGTSTAITTASPGAQ